MDTDKREYFRGVLQEEMRVLLEEAGKTVLEMTSDNTNFPDPNDRATQESDRSFELRIRDRERKLINKIKEALERIDEDTFGICEMCGEDISEARLKARPVTTLCIDCKIEQEKREKLRWLRSPIARWRRPERQSDATGQPTGGGLRKSPKPGSPRW